MVSEQLPTPHAHSKGPEDGLDTGSPAAHSFKICANGRLYKLSVASLPAEFAGPSPGYDGPAPDVMEAVWAREAAMTGDTNAIDRFASRVLFCGRAAGGGRPYPRLSWGIGHSRWTPPMASPTSRQSPNCALRRWCFTDSSRRCGDGSPAARAYCSWILPSEMG
jgi:hypothetical protein